MAKAMDLSRLTTLTQVTMTPMDSEHNYITDIVSYNYDYTEEYANEYHDDMLKTFATRPYLWSTHVWNMFDFTSLKYI